ncbi:RING-type domain-containing protein [Forsythia ovata]|uniref:RING-type domain-containing protein n=1 Tax=Forsythia ovata TaxID=205694 RepID=A0ABD1P7L1_9LAMI
MDLIYDLRGQMEQLRQEMSELRRSIRSCINMQIKFQRSIKQEAAAALSHSDENHASNHCSLNNWTHLPKSDEDAEVIQRYNYQCHWQKAKREDFFMRLTVFKECFLFLAEHPRARTHVQKAIDGAHWRYSIEVYVAESSPRRRKLGFLKNSMEMVSKFKIRRGGVVEDISPPPLVPSAASGPGTTVLKVPEMTTDSSYILPAPEATLEVPSTSIPTRPVPPPGSGRQSRKRKAGAKSGKEAFRAPTSSPPGKYEYINIGSRRDELDPTVLGKLPPRLP